MLEIRNAKIESVKLTSADYGVLSAWLFVDYGGGAGQGFGGYSLYLPRSFKQYSINSPAGHFIWRCMEIAEVDEWSKLPGKAIRVRSNHSGIEAIGHILKDDWFCPSEDFKAAL